MEITFTETLTYLSIVFFGTPTIYYLTKSDITNDEITKGLRNSFCIGTLLILLSMAGIYGVDKSSILIGKLFSKLIKTIVLLSIGLIVTALSILIIGFIVLGNKKQNLINLKNNIIKITKLWK